MKRKPFLKMNPSQKKRKKNVKEVTRKILRKYCI